jgi:hypothetical protein
VTISAPDPGHVAYAPFVQRYAVAFHALGTLKACLLEDYAAARGPSNTEKSLKAFPADFEALCAASGLTAAPERARAAYLVQLGTLAGLSRAASVFWAHEEAEAAGEAKALELARNLGAKARSDACALLLLCFTQSTDTLSARRSAWSARPASPYRRSDSRGFSSA